MKKKKKAIAKVLIAKLRRADYHEAADRISVIEWNVQEHLAHHHALQGKEQQERLEKILKHLAELYQWSGSKM